MNLKKVCMGGAFIASLVATPFIVQWEGTKNEAYQDIVGVWTICSGETQNVYEGMVLSDRECRNLTEWRVLEFAQGIDDMVNVPMSAQYHAALTSWAYNVGLGAAQRSTLIRRLNMGDYQGACEELKRWNRAGGRVIRGLNNRRLDEYEMCIEGIQ